MNTEFISGQVPIKQDISYSSKSKSQIFDTIQFDMRRNAKKTLNVLIVFVIFFVLNNLLQYIQESRGISSIDNAIDLASQFLGMLFLFVIYICGTTYGGELIAIDFEKQTGNLLFPKISKGRLMVGRIISRMILCSFCIAIYYILVSVICYVEYQEIPSELFASYGWALLFMFSILSIVTFFSSFMKTSTSAIVISLLLLLVVFNLVSQILQMTGSRLEPLFILTYYGNIIANSLNMPIDRFMERVFHTPMGDVTIYSWSTPSYETAFIGMITFSLLFLIIAI
jgi:ABC-type transport system involved in multi-copper enzyme maturation permease subunit